MSRRRTYQLKWITALATLALTAVAFADSVPFWGAKASVPIDTPIKRLKRGEFLWMGEAVNTGPLVVVVSITEQRAYVYRNGILIGATTVSTGRPGYPTPVGVFTVLQKQKEHRSTLYDSAPMPYMERLTWDGVALHAGGLPGYPESHGCIHLPSEFARRLFEISPAGMTVVISAEPTSPSWVAHPGFLTPVTSVGGQAADPTADAPAEFDWHPELSPSGPISIVLSQASQCIVVYRNGVEIGRARVTVLGDAPLLNHALVLTQGASSVPDPYLPDPAKFHWMRIGVPGHMGEAGTDVDPTAVARIHIPADFVALVSGLLTTGTTVFVTHDALYPETTGKNVQVVDADPPVEDPAKSARQRRAADARARIH